ncbi:MAG: hypothetical protein LBC42_03800 [Puniceicoccales bacterium]|jgi:hypothetical protein|nr:hypothetical protein [Puniceicoccales bacterium]
MKKILPSESPAHKLLRRGGGFMRSLGEAEKAKKFRYVVNVLVERVPESSDSEEIALFFRALRTLESNYSAVSKTHAVMRCFFTHLRAYFSRNGRAQLQCILRWLLIFPKSIFLLRRLMNLSRFASSPGEIFISAGQMLPLEKLSRSKQLQLCRELLQKGREVEAAAVAKAILRLAPDSVEARHLLWSALLQSGESGKN